MSVLLVVLTLGLIFNNEDFLGSAGGLEDGLNLGTGDMRGSDGRVFAVVDKEYLVKNDLIPFLKFSWKGFNANHVADGYGILLAPSCYNCKFCHNRPYNTRFPARVNWDSMEHMPKLFRARHKGLLAFCSAQPVGPCKARQKFGYVFQSRLKYDTAQIPKIAIL